MPEMTIAGETFNVLVEGPERAPALMLSNSLGTDLHMWDAQMPALLKHFRVVRYDSRGHGKSVASPGPYSIRQLAADALAIMDALDLTRVHWMGLSKGGMVGQYLLTHHPERISRAVLANTASAMGPPDLWNDRIRTVTTKGMKAITPGVIERWFTGAFQTDGAKAIAPIVDMLHATPAAGYAACCGAIRDMDQRWPIRAIKAPVLVIVGKKDPATPPEAGRRIADSIPGAKLVALEAAHLSNIEAASAFTKAALGFLTEAAKPRAKAAVKKKAATAKQAASKKTPRRT